MRKTVLWSLAVLVVAAALALAGGSKKKVAYEEPLKEDKPFDPNAQYHPLPAPDWSRVTDVGTPTTLTGFYDYQSNGGALQQLRVNPANGNIHVTYMLADDSTAAGLNSARRVAYAFSSNNGSTWNNFNNLRIPSRRAGFPTIDLLRGPNAGLPVIVNHNVVNAAFSIQPLAYVDSPEGAGAFSELNAPPDGGFTTDQPIWPYVAGASDGSIVMAASRSTAATAHYTRTADFATWSSWTQVTEVTQSGGRYPVQANGTGRVGMLFNTSNGTAALGNWWLESTNNGQTWSTPVNLFGQRYVGTDTMNSYVHCDFVYNGNTPLFVFSEYVLNVNREDEEISFYSQPTGWKIAVPHDTSKYKFDPVNQRFHALRLGWPSIGMSGSTIVVAYQAFQADTDRLGYHFSDLWYVASSNGGTTWGAPQRITNTPNVDERYPSVSKYNAAGQFNIVWTQKNGSSGLYAFPGGADTVRASQMFLRVSPIVFGGTSVDDGKGVANSFKLSQNYPNPFNPATKIDYTVAQAGSVSIKVYNELGQEVATLLNETLAPGSYQVTFDGKDLASGVYIYKMTAGSYVESKKMLLMK
jgi:hypothetical protein